MKTVAAIDLSLPEAHEDGGGALRQPARLAWSTFFALLGVPAIWLAYFVFSYGVNIPCFDQWIGMAPVFESMEHGTLCFSDFAAPHNEHRILLPRLIFFVLARLTHWNTRAEMALTWFVFWLMAASLWKLLDATGWRARPATYGLFAALGLLAFDPLQEQNLINGWGFHYVVALAFLLAGIWAAVALNKPWHLFGSALLASAATFSMGIGLGAWLLYPPLLAAREQGAWRRPWLGFWVAAFGLNLLCYFWGCHRPPSSPGTALPHAAEAARYFLVYLGTPFAWGTAFDRIAVAEAVGLALVGWSGALGVLLWRKRKDAILLRARPWLVVAAIGVLQGVLTTAGRCRLGIEQAMETRYVAYADMLPIGLFVVSALLVDRSPSRARAQRARAWWIAATPAAALLALHLLSVFARIDAWPQIKHHRMLAKAIVQTLDVVDQPDLFGRVTPEPGRLRSSARALARLGYLQPSMLSSRDIATIADTVADGMSGNGHHGSIEQSAREGDRVAVMGWAVLPERLEAADAVLLTYDDAKGVPTIFALTPVFGRRPDVVGSTGEPGYEICGWRHLFPASLLPDGAEATCVIKAWAYDAEYRRAYRLAGSVPVRGR